MNVVEVLTENLLKCGRIGGLIYTQIRGYCTFWKWVLRLGGGRGHEVMLYGWGIFGP